MDKETKDFNRVEKFVHNFIVTYFKEKDVRDINKFVTDCKFEIAITLNNIQQVNTFIKEVTWLNTDLGTRGTEYQKCEGNKIIVEKRWNAFTISVPEKVEFDLNNNIKYDYE